MKPTCVIVDIDGTLADCEHRKHLSCDMNPKHIDWHKFKDPVLVAQDAVIKPVAEVVRALAAQFFPIIFVSGRDEDVKVVTKSWLHKNDLWFPGSELHTRKNGDYRCDTVVKKEILDAEILPRFRVLCAIDDRNKVVDMWRANGIQCLQVAPGDF